MEGKGEDDFMYNLGLDYMKKAKDLEMTDKIEAAFRCYKEAGNKFMYLAKNETSNPAKKKQYEDLVKKAIDQALWLKLTIDEKKTKLKQQVTKSKAQMTLGLKLLGPNYMEAFNYYNSMGDYFFSLVSKNKGILPAVKICYIIAAENLNHINQIVKDEPTKAANNKKLGEIIQFVEGLQQKIHSDPLCDAKKAKLLSFDQKERTIIEAGSFIRGINYDVWAPEKGITNIFDNKEYDDPDGLLTLSLKQMKHFKSWVRPHEVIDRKHFINGRPDIATNITGYEIMQRKIGDCSVLSSLAVAAHYELKWKYQKKLVSCLIYPQDQNGNPVYNPCGKYIVKLFINGMWRGVEVDDYLPIDSYGNFICAYSNKGKLWISLIEKAYLKVHGGYEFIGSNSSRDLYALTGWLPEKIELKQYNRQKLWERIKTGYRNNDCLITIGTGLIQDEEAVGLVSNHAYGVLEIFEYQNHRILLVKNPWGHFRWNGKFSTEDKVNWTPELKKVFHYDDLNMTDNGIFWIDIDSVCEYFESLDMNWNPELLVYQKSFFDLWKAADMIHSSTFSIKTNPQYCIQFKDDGTPFTYDTIILWVVISKMLIAQDGHSEEEEKASDYIAMHCYPNTNINHKVLEDRNALVKSVYTNEQNYIMYLQLPTADYFNKQKVLNLVLDQHQRTKDLYFNIRVYSNCPFYTQRADFNYKYKKTIEIPNVKGGGVPNSPYFYQNPQFYLHFDRQNVVNPQNIKQVEALASFSSSAGADVKMYLCHCPNKSRITHIGEGVLVDQAMKQEPYKPLIAHLHYKINPTDFYSMIVSSFKADMSIGGLLTIESDQPLNVMEFQPEGSKMKKLVIQDDWDFKSAGGCGNFGMFDKNPAFALNIPSDSELQVRIRIMAEVAQDGSTLITESDKFSYCANLQVYRIQSTRFPPPAGSIPISTLQSPILTTYNGKYSNNLSALVSEKKQVTKGLYVVIPSTFNPQQLGKFEIIVYSGCSQTEWSKYQ